MTERLHIHSAVSVTLMTLATSVTAYCFIDRPMDRLRHAMFPIHKTTTGFSTTGLQAERLPKPVLPLGAALHGVEMLADKGWTSHSTEDKQRTAVEASVQAKSGH